MIRLTDYKFRVYDESLGMLTVKTVNFKTNIIELCSVLCTPYRITCKDLLQVSNLLDCKGVYIAEEDILRSIKNNKLYIVKCDTLDNFKLLNYQTNTLIDLANCECFEIIGNTYQHKHILKEWKNEYSKTKAL